MYHDYFGEAAGPPQSRLLQLRSRFVARDRREQRHSGAQGHRADEMAGRGSAAHKTECTLAYWHIARYSSGAHGSDPLMADAWKILYDAGRDVVLASHDHDYERFAPMDDQRQTGRRRDQVVRRRHRRRRVYEFKGKAQNSEVKDNTTYGVLKMSLKPGSYDWEFIPMPGKTFRDSGSGKCSAVK